MKVDGLMGPTPRMSANLSVARQTPDTSFGARVQAGVNNVSGAVASGVGLAAGMVPGGGIVSAAVSSMSTLSSNGVAGSGTSNYVGGGIPMSGGGAGAVSNTGVPSISTTVNTGGGVGLPGAGASSGGPSFQSGNASEFNGELASMFQQQKELLKLQSAMQNESQKYQAVSNVMKTRHESAKNAIGNIR